MSTNYPNGTVGTGPSLTDRISDKFASLRSGFPQVVQVVGGVAIGGALLALTVNYGLSRGGTTVDAPEFAGGVPDGHHRTIQSYSGVFTLADKETHIYADGVTEHGTSPNLTFCIERGVRYVPNGPDELYDGQCIPRDQLTIPGGYRFQ